MSTLQMPARRPETSFFSSGPCKKRPGWSIGALDDACVGRSHRSKPAKAKIQRLIEKSRTLLAIPADYHVGIMPGSDTGAFEAVMWSLLGARGVDLLAWESFGHGWVTDAVKQLKLPDTRTLTADYGRLPDLSQVDPARDVVFTWNGTTSGVRVPDGSWIAPDRDGLTLCDATSAIFAMQLPWDRLDAVTWSWQKVLGGEAAHGMLVLSPRAVERLESYSPPWPLPKLFRLTKSGKFNEGIFRGDTINTPSMLCVEDQLDALQWAEEAGGLAGLVKRADANLSAMESWVAESDWAAFLADAPAYRSTTSVCLSFKDAWFSGLPDDRKAPFAKDVASRLESAGVAHDIASYRDAPPGLRIWCGATIDTADVEALLPWLDWAFHSAKADASSAVAA